MIRITQQRIRLCAILLTVNLLFIWGNSMLPGHVSEAFSQWVKDLIARILPGGLPGAAGHGLLRKIAHFSEFCLLGCLLSWLFHMLKKNPFQATALPLACGFLAACIDETIQIFTPGRGPRFTDVLIDTGGVTLGIALIWLGRIIYQKKKSKT